MKLMKRCTAAGAMLFAGSALAQDYPQGGDYPQGNDYRQGSEWARASNGDVPDNAIQGGRESNGQPLYICSARYNNGRHPGKLRREFGGCNIAWGGREVTVQEYEVLLRGYGYNWVRAENGEVPNGAVPGGHEQDHQEHLFVCTAEYGGGAHPGKLRGDFGGCNIPYGGKEVTVHRYSVLTRRR